MPKKEDVLIKEITDRFSESYDADNEENEEMLDDLRFTKGDQWPSSLKAEREADGRPCLVINKLPTFVDQVTGDIRQNTPQIIVKPVDSQADPDTAEVITGLLRNIQMQSQADIAYDTAIESSVICGKGAFRIVTEYCDDDVFEQEIKIRRIKNPLCIYWDPASQEWDRSDARYCFVTEMVSREEFKKRYPKATLKDAAGGKDKNIYWSHDKSIRVAEYLVKKPIVKTLYLLRNPLTGEQYVKEQPEEGMEIIRQREVETNKVMSYKTNGTEILEEGEFPSKYIPVVMVYGKELTIEGVTYYRGVVRHAKDAQRLYNYSRSTGAELISLVPKSPYLVTMKMIGSYQKIWDKAHKKNFPYLPFNVDLDLPSFPKRAEPVSSNPGIQTEILIADQELHDTTGLQLASLGKKSNEKSGRAIIARQKEGDIANFAYFDNLARALHYAGKILLDIVPKIYDTERVVRLLNEDGTEKFAVLNASFIDRKTGKRAMYDLTVGKYDVIISIGPSYGTQREEAAQGMLAFLQTLPQQAALIADQVVESMDWPGAQKIAKRLRKALPPGLVDEPDAAPTPPPPPDMDMQDHEIKMKQEQATLEGIELDNKKKIMEMQRMEAEFALKSIQQQKANKNK